jgi:hypothetical protein
MLDNLVRRARAAVLLLALSSPLLAQTLSVPTSAPAGASISITYANATLAGKTVMILASGGMPPSTVEIPVTVGSDGSVTVDWTPPAGWRVVTFSAPGCNSQSTTIQ